MGRGQLQEQSPSEKDVLSPVPVDPSGARHPRMAVIIGISGWIGEQKLVSSALSQLDAWPRPLNSCAVVGRKDSLILVEVGETEVLAALVCHLIEQCIMQQLYIAIAVRFGVWPIRREPGF